MYDLSYSAWRKLWRSNLRQGLLHLASSCLKRHNSSRSVLWSISPAVERSEIFHLTSMTTVVALATYVYQSKLQFDLIHSSLFFACCSSIDQHQLVLMQFSYFNIFHQHCKVSSFHQMHFMKYHEWMMTWWWVGWISMIYLWINCICNVEWTKVGLS